MTDLINNNLIINFIKNTFPEVKAALLTGSYSKGKNKKNSDIDIMIFSEAISQPFVEKIKIDSIKYDIICFSTHFNYLIRTFYLDINSRYGVYFNMITSSTILFDDDGFLQELVYFAKNEIHKEYGKLHTDEVEFKIKTISNAIEDIDDIEDYGEYYYTVYLIVEELTNLLLAHKLSTIGRGKRKARELQILYPVFYSQLMRSIEIEDKKEFKKLVTEKLLYFGGLLETYSLKNVPSINSKTDYEIFIQKKYLKDDLTIKNISNISKTLTQVNVSLIHLHFSYENLVLTVKLGKINTHTFDYIKSWIMYHLKIHSNDKVIIRTKKSRILPFCDNVLNEAIEKDMSLLTNLLLDQQNDIKNKLNVFIFGNLLINTALDNLNITNKNDFFNYFYQSNLPAIYDVDVKCYNYEELIKKRKEVIQDIYINNNFLIKLPEKLELFNLFNKDAVFISYLNKVNSDKRTLMFNENNDVFFSKKLLLNLYFKNILDILSPNKLSLIAYNNLQRKNEK